MSKNNHFWLFGNTNNDYFVNVFRNRLFGITEFIIGIKRQVLNYQHQKNLKRQKGF